MNHTKWTVRLYKSCLNSNFLLQADKTSDVTCKIKFVIILQYITVNTPIKNLFPLKIFMIE